jgi:hypothetical protein
MAHVFKTPTGVPVALLAANVMAHAQHAAEALIHEHMRQAVMDLNSLIVRTQGEQKRALLIERDAIMGGGLPHDN